MLDPLEDDEYGDLKLEYCGVAAILVCLVLDLEFMVQETDE